MYSVSYIDVLEKLEQLLNEMDYIVDYINRLHDFMYSNEIESKYKKYIQAEINRWVEVYEVKMRKYSELIKLLNTIVIYNAHKPIKEENKL